MKQDHCGVLVCGKDANEELSTTRLPKPLGDMLDQWRTEHQLQHKTIDPRRNLPQTVHGRLRTDEETDFACKALDFDTAAEAIGDIILPMAMDFTSAA